MSSLVSVCIQFGSVISLANDLITAVTMRSIKLMAVAFTSYNSTCIQHRIVILLLSYNIISVQSTGRTRSSSLVTLARPSVSSSLQITNRSFTYASPYLWNQLHSSFRQPHSVQSLSSWFTSSCAYHLITVTAFALITYHCVYLPLQT